MTRTRLFVGVMAASLMWAVCSHVRSGSDTPTRLMTSEADSPSRSERRVSATTEEIDIVSAVPGRLPAGERDVREFETAARRVVNAASGGPEHQVALEELGVAFRRLSGLTEAQRIRVAHAWAEASANMGKPVH